MKGSIALLPLALLVAGLTLAAQLKHYEGDIVAVDAKARTITVKRADSGSPAEMIFHIDNTSEVSIDGEHKLFAELQKGDRVRIGYTAAGKMHMVKKAERKAKAKANPKELVFEGDITNVDARAHTFTVRSNKAGKVEEMVFHARPATRFYFGGDHLTLMGQLRNGETVTVHYENANNAHDVMHVAKTKKGTS